VSYLYNLAGQLTSVTDPFNASFTYTRDVQGRLKTLTGSPYAGTTNYITDVQYRAWGAPKSVVYTNTTSTIGYWFRLEPRDFRLTANANGGSVMREDYSYFGDGKLASLTDLDDTPGSNPPATLRFLSRAYSYDQAGRIQDAHGTGSGSMQGVPFAQTYGYDQFDNLTSRSGSYYNYTFNPPATDTATYVNNRRTNWTYNAEGQVLTTPSTSTDSPRSMTYDAAGRMVSSVETNQFNTVTYSAAYDGDGELAFESSVTNPGTSQTSYIVRSTVLGDVLTRLDQAGNKKITHVPAEGLLFATQRTDGPGPFVLFTQRNPLGISETTKAVYDPLGNYIPFQASGDPRPPAGSFSSASLGALSSSQANPFSYAVGCMIDGVPTTCNKVVHAINNSQGKTLQIDARQNPNVLLANMGIFLVEYPSHGGKLTKPHRIPFQPNPKPGNPDPYNVGRDEHTWALALVSFEYAPADTAGVQLSECLRNALRAYFPQQTAQGKTYSPIDDARFKNWIPSSIQTAAEVTPGAVEPAAITLGLYDIHYDPGAVNINGGDVFSLETVLEEVSHTIQFLQVWNGMKPSILARGKLRELSLNYNAAKTEWAKKYLYYAVKGLGYDNDIERWAKSNVQRILSDLRKNAGPNQGQICGFDLYPKSR
jgi:YD repeat-containing protein